MAFDPSKYKVGPKPGPRSISKSPKERFIITINKQIDLAKAAQQGIMPPKKTRVWFKEDASGKYTVTNPMAEPSNQTFYGLGTLNIVLDCLEYIRDQASKGAFDAQLQKRADMVNARFGTGGRRGRKKKV